MKQVMVIFFMLPTLLAAQDAARFARAMERGPTAVDRWMKHALMSQKRGDLIDNGSTTYTVHYHTYDTLVAFLQQQPGVLAAGWDKCIAKLASWPGHSRIGVRYISNGIVYERCYSLQEGRPGNIELFGWRAHVRKSREQLKFMGAQECPGFVEEQQRYCVEENH